MTRTGILTIRARAGDDGGRVVTARGRKAWALLALVAAGERIETVREPHGGPFPGEHARYMLRSAVRVLDRTGDAP